VCAIIVSECSNMLTVLLVFATAMVSLPSCESQSSVQCSSVETQFNMDHQEPIQEYCQLIRSRFNDTAYRIDFTQSEVDRICNDDICMGVLQQLVVSCSTFVSCPACTLFTHTELSRQ